jgi:hypothetical protein
MGAGRTLLPLRAWLCSGLSDVIVRSIPEAADLPSCAFAGDRSKGEAFDDGLGSTRFASTYQFIWMLNDSVAAEAAIHQRQLTGVARNVTLEPDAYLSVPLVTSMIEQTFVFERVVGMTNYLVAPVGNISILTC